MSETVWFIVALLVAFWAIGMVVRFVGRIVHLLLFVAVAIVLYNYLT